MKATEHIECPYCEHRFDADVEWQDGEPFPTYVAECPACTFIIGEDDWNRIDSD
ncbi:hypothetical protein LCGC14_2226560 [marine sediment metagenome]|uniref:CPXCG motif-containing cysteine-rich protein n=1 Tax=marine sediment metagenome TaxID=412755 RepID=A0A0F9G4X0_9ZZZZ